MVLNHAELPALKRLVVLFELTGSILLSLWLLNILELKLIEVAIELNVGVLITFFLMLLMASIPLKILNGVCNLVEEQLDLGKYKSGLLTFSVFHLWALLHIIQLRRID